MYNIPVRHVIIILRHPNVPQCFLLEVPGKALNQPRLHGRVVSSPTWRSHNREVYSCCIIARAPHSKDLHPVGKYNPVRTDQPECGSDGVGVPTPTAVELHVQDSLVTELAVAGKRGTR